MVFWFLISTMVARFLSLMIHELGHALPALAFTDKPVKVIIGVSRENDKNSISLYLGRLEIFMKINPLNWIHGYCVFEPQGISKSKYFIIVASGAVFTFISAIALFYYNFHSGSGDVAILFCFVFAFSSVVDLFTNLVPNSKPFYYNGLEMYNDGYLLKKRVFTNTERYDQFYKRIEYHTRFNEFGEAVEECYKAITAFPKDRPLYHQAIHCLYKLSREEELYKLIEKMQEAIGLDNFAFNFKGMVLLHKNDLQAAETCFAYAIVENGRDDVAYNNRGYVRGMMGKYKESIEDLNQAILLNHKAPFPYNNRGYAFMMLGEMERAYEDLSQSMKLDPNNAYCFRNFGIYFLKKNQKDVALIYFNKAKEIDAKVPLLKEYEEEALAGD